jgi:ribosomal protein S27AE
MNTITIKTFDNYFYANIILTKLEDAGIQCWLKDEHTVTIDPILSNAIGGIKLVVRETDVTDALNLLKQFEEEYMKSVHCPRCGAAALTLINKPGATNVLTAIFTWIFSNYAVATEQVYKCGQCGYETKTLPATVNEDELHE